MSLEAYSVAVKVSLINAVSPALLGLMRQFKAAGVEAEVLQRRIDGVKRGLLFSGVQIGLGVGLLAMLKPAVDQAKQFEQITTKFATSYGMGDIANDQAVKFAKSMDIMGASALDAMNLVYEAQGVFRESGALNLQQQFVGAKIAAPILAKLGFIESGLGADERASRHAQDLAMLRFIEARGGANDPRIFSGIADWGFRLSKSSGGIVDWSQLQQMTATAGPMTRTLSQDAISKLEPIIADLKGGRTGSGLRVAFQRLLGTQRGLPKQAVAEYMKLGLWDPSMVELTKQGSIKRFLGRPGEVFKGRLQFTNDPVDFFQNTFLPAIAKKYGAQILGNSPEAVTERAVEESLVFGPGTASAVFAQMDKLMPAIQRSLAAQQKSLGIDATYKATGKTLAGQEVDIAAKFHDLLLETGKVVLPVLVAGLEALLPVLKFISGWAQAHPRVFGGIIDGLMILGGALIVSGIYTGLAALGGLIDLVGGAIASAGILNLAAAAETIPVIGGAIGEGLLSLGIGIGGIGAAIAAIPVGTIVAVAAAIASVGVAIYEMWKHWDSSKTVFQNLKSEIGGFLDWAQAQTKTKRGGQVANSAEMAVPWLIPTVELLKHWQGVKTAFTAFFSGFAAEFTRNLAPLKAAWDGAQKALGGFIDWFSGFILKLENLIPPWMRGGAAAAHPAAPGSAPPKKNAGFDWMGMFGAAGNGAADTLFGKGLGYAQAVDAATRAAANNRKGIAALTTSHQTLAKAEIDGAHVVLTAMQNFAAQMARIPPPANAPTIQVTTHTSLDGRQIAKTVSIHQARAIGGVNAGIPWHDPNASLASPGAGYHR